MRSLWKGHIRFSMVTIPIRLYSAVDSGKSISFNQLHKQDNGRVRYEKVCRSCSESLSGSDIVKGYEYGPDEYVIIEDEDFDKVKIKSSKIIEIEGFVSADEVDVSIYDTPYFAGPDGDVAVKVYALLAKVEGKEVVMAADDEVTPVVDIMTALRESIEAAKGDAKPMERAATEAESTDAADATDAEQGDKSAPKKKATRKKAATKAKAKTKTEAA